LLLLLVGAWLLIQPFTRRPGETIQVYITVIAYEVYIWLLLLLGRWQVRKGLASDAARSGIFALVLIGLAFIALNELYYLSKPQGLIAVGLFSLLSILKLFVGPRMFGVSLPRPFIASGVAWIAALAVPAAVIAMLPVDSSARHCVGYLSFWCVAILLALHIPLVRWHVRHSKTDPNKSFLERWQMPWVVVGVLALLAVAQLYSTMWGLYVGVDFWYYGPVFLAGTALLIALAEARHFHQIAVWWFLVLTIINILIRWGADVPSELPASWREGVMSYFVHPIYPNLVWFCLLFVLMAVSLRRLFMLVFASVPILGSGAVIGCRVMMKWKYGRGMAVLLGAFVVLMLGVLAQWYQVRYRPRITPPAPDQENPDDENGWDQVPPIQAPPEGQAEIEDS